ncbi:hypothetical protein KIN20_015933 [Parelaphostrongylus tenuis]|uniref:Uncharacterized protein n=1 Tax=Parelaphostrongylus tenuis TaxID=148309 RepID=A0AAD5QST4_PARTN|nr:hypothetical protein KIN20_015933 [Parelaphostrongylus tenuis]
MRYALCFAFVLACSVLLPMVAYGVPYYWPPPQGPSPCPHWNPSCGTFPGQPYGPYGPYGPYTPHGWIHNHY